LVSLFGSSGIRGKLDEKLTSEFCLEIGKAIGSTLPVGSRICLSTDTRTSGDALSSGIISGLLSVGVNVTKLGILPTPALALLTKELCFDAGIMVTASHNPPDYNGVKLFNNDSLGFSSKQEGNIERIFLSKHFRQANWDEYGRLAEDRTANEKYLLTLKKKALWQSDPHIKLVIDPGNGAASNLATMFFQELGFKVFSINDEPDGSFPGRDPEPSAESLRGTVEFLNECNADLAISFDGDADRVVFCDRQGFLGYNEMIAFLSRLAVRQSGNKTVATTVETGRLLDIAVADLGAQVYRTKVGDVALAYSTRELDAAIGVEPVGVYILPQLGYYPDSFLATLLLLSQLKDVGDIRSFFSSLPPFFFESTKIPCDNVLKEKVTELCQKEVINIDSGQVNTLDGIRSDFSDSWLLIRPSGTEPVVRVVVEANSQSQLKRLMAHGVNLVEKAIIKSRGRR